MQGVSLEKASEAESVFRSHGGILRTSKAIELGVHPRTLYYLRDTGRLHQVSRGIYRLADLPLLETPDLVTVSLRLPDAVICLISAMAFHDITDEIPHEVYISLPRGTKRPELEYPPLRVFHFSGLSMTEGVEEHEIDEVPVRIYSAAKTVADSFKFRNKIGIDVAIESLRRYMKREKASPRELLYFARICRVERVMQPYLEAMI